MSIETINPATGEVIAQYTVMSFEKINLLLQSMQLAQYHWQDTPFSIRAEKMLKVASLLEQKKEIYAKQITMEMGKPIVAARAEIEKCQWVCTYYAQEAQSLLSPRTIETHYQKSYVTYEPLGIIFAIMPWNFPFWQVFRFAAPNLMGGNAGLLSHSQNVTGCALLLTDLFHEAGFPENLFYSAIVDHDTSKKIIAQDCISAVTLTGSERAGRIVGAQTAGALKKVVLELGGSDPYVILADADSERAADHIVKSRLNNSGQVCIAAKRIIVVPEIEKQLKALIREKIKDYRMGDPSLTETNLGPLARADLRETVHQQVQQSIALGAQLLCGGELPDTKGFFYPPTMLEKVRPGMPAFDEELFGPVIAMISAKDEVDAIGLANQSRFGLSAAVFTKDLEKGEKIARDKIKVGTCYVNGLVSSDPRLPFGGIKSSGYGRELGAEGIREFMNIKTICIAK
ncbi:MAG: succinate-semialdehyde dehydrogenase [Gammaproteobacteria bacterium CG_4_10_14_0_8_um_filter_38_16]|nr:MAG: succinate-semialdehyde dehydrogenase [Gammaproteobacteria bacterium CG_4_10_14_0_8_um_filter_38_16]PJA02760.1 MAG: succinate-semialdehyde dehydrogenase [Gammaproteobacteria bacterium CG_4_10_14_0_2_um_filter_38_22]PJB10416.1 MAG: succinate-semialdehyde dehydrogenase [Gammaproteobacteria bacterium CG_4_9_14_3_um_filter_38_9]